MAAVASRNRTSDRMVSSLARRRWLLYRSFLHGTRLPYGAEIRRQVQPIAFDEECRYTRQVVNYDAFSCHRSYGARGAQSIACGQCQLHAWRRFDLNQIGVEDMTNSLHVHF